MEWVKDGEIEIFDDIENRMVIERRNFEVMFGVLTDYNSLISHANCTEMWRQIYDNWKERGIIS